MDNIWAGFGISLLLGLLPAYIAKQKGYRFARWWSYGTLLFIIALPIILFKKPNPERELIAQRDTSKKTSYGWLWAILFVIVGGTATVFGLYFYNEWQTQAYQPDHYWVMKDGDSYGYQGDLSQDDKNAGVASKSLIMAQYLGIKNGAYVVSLGGNDSETLLISCAPPCNFIKFDYYEGMFVAREETYPAGDSIAHAIMQDAMSGQMVRAK